MSKDGKRHRLRFEIWILLFDIFNLGWRRFSLLIVRHVTVGNPSVKGGKMTGGRTRVVFGETLCLPARSPAFRSLAEGRRFGEGRAAPLPV